MIENKKETLVKVEFLCNAQAPRFGDYKKGEVALFEKAKAEVLVKRGLCKLVKNNPPIETKKIKTREEK